MKKQLFSLFFILSLFSAKAQWVSIPDSNFGKWLTTKYPTCMQGNPQIGFQMDTTCGAIVSETVVDCINKGIVDLTGVQYFKSAQLLDCSFNNLIRLEKLPNSLYRIDCMGSHLSFIEYFPSNLYEINCGGNELDSLPEFPLGLVKIEFSYNNLYAIPKLSYPIEYIVLTGNNISNIDSFPNSIIHLDLIDNNISHLPTLPNNLNVLGLSNNKIICLPKLPNTIEHFDIANNFITCLPNIIRPTYFDIDPANLPLCSPSTGCDFFYNKAVTGNAHQKNQLTCADDSIIPGAGLHNLKIKLIDNNQQTLQQFYTDNFGQYSFEVDSLVSYSIEVDTTNSPFIVECPSTFFQTANLSPTDSLIFDKNFGVTCNPNADYLVQNVFADRFRPAFQTTVHPNVGNASKIIYGANCPNNFSGTVKINFSGAIQYVSPAPNALTPSTVASNFLIYQISNLDSLNIGDLDFIVSTDSFAAINSQVCFDIQLTPNIPDNRIANNQLQHCFNIVNSYDPNEKTVYPKTITSDGDWLTYTIQFQNTGNDTAYTVVVKDTLPQDLVAESFQYLASSHKNIIQIKGQEVVFTFPSINLVDSATNEPLSHGWVQFKIKTKNNLPPTFNIANRAAIFFDFNSPIFTNYAVTTQPTGIQNLKNEIAFSVFPNPFTQQFTILTNEKEKVTATIMDIMGKTIATKDFQQQTTIDLSAVAKGIYLVQLTNTKGEKGVYKLVKE